MKTDTTAIITSDATPSTEFTLTDLKTRPKFTRHRHFNTFKGYNKHALAEKTGLSYSYFTACLYGMAKPSKAAQAQINRVAEAIIQIEGK